MGYPKKASGTFQTHWLPRQVEGGDSIQEPESPPFRPPIPTAVSTHPLVPTPSQTALSA